MSSELKGLSYKVSINGLYDDYFTFSYIGADKADITTGNISSSTGAAGFPPEWFMVITGQSIL